MRDRHRRAPAAALALAIELPLGRRLAFSDRRVRARAFPGVDWRQTLDRRYVESNPLLGSHPSSAAVTGYFLGAMAVQVAIARLLPTPWRGVFQGMTLGVEGRSVVNNWRLGARVGW